MKVTAVLDGTGTGGAETSAERGGTVGRQIFDDPHDHSELGRDMTHLDDSVSPDVSVIIPAHNAETVIGDQLQALSRQNTEIAFDVIVVLNRCTDRTEDVVRRHEGALNIRVLRADEHGSAAFARNCGTRAATAPVLLFCDADDEVEPNWVSGMWRSLLSADFCGGRRLMNYEGLPSWTESIRPAVPPGQERLHTWDGRLPYPITATFGCRRDALEAVGGFDESYAGASSEDADLAWRLYRAGYRANFAHDADLLYRPRDRFGDLLRQRKGYAAGDALLAQKEGWLQAPSHRQELRQLAAAVYSSTLRSWPPRWRRTVLAVSWIHHRAAARRQLARTSGAVASEPDPVVDFASPLDTPIIGGLAFLDRRSVARRYFSDGLESSAVYAIDRILRPGDTMIDCCSHNGLAVVAAALRAGSHGRVIAYESDPDRAQILARNVTRHAGELPITRISRDFDPADVLPHHLNLIRLGSPSAPQHGASHLGQLIESHPESSFLLPFSEGVIGDNDHLMRRISAGRWRFYSVHSKDGTATFRQLDAETFGTWSEKLRRNDYLIAVPADSEAETRLRTRDAT